MSRTSRVRVEFDADTRGLQRGTQRAERHIDRVGKAGLVSAKKLAGIGAAFIGVAGAGSFVKSAANETIGLAKSTAALARTTGMETEASSRWVAIAKARGVEGKALNMGFISLSKSMAAAADGGDKQIAMFKELGVSSEAIRKGDTQTAVLQLSDAFAKMPDGANKAALAQKLFGRQSQTLMPLLNKGSGALKEQLALSDKYGLTMNKNQVEQALKAAAAQRELGMSMDGLKVSLGSVLMPALAAAAGGVADFVAGFRTGDGAGGFIGDMFTKAKPILEDAKTWIKGTFDSIKRSLNLGDASDLRQTMEAVRNFGRIVGSVVLPLVRGAFAQMRTVISSWAGVVGGVIRVFTGVFTGDWRKAWNGVKQIFSSALKGVLSILKLNTGILRSAARAIGNGILSGLKSIGSGMLSAGKWLIGKAGDGIKGAYNYLKEKGKSAGNSALSGLKSIGGKVLAAGEWVVDKIGDGISRAITRLANVGKKIATTIINAVKSALGIKSPSRVFEQIGNYMVQGLARGISPGNVRGLLGKAFGGTKNFVKAMVRKGFASISSLPGKFAKWFGLGGGGGLVPQVRRALAWARKHGWHGAVTSGYRSPEKQRELWNNRHNNPYPVAPPGTSMHEKGMAVDVTDPTGFRAAMSTAPASSRLIWYGPGDPVHFSVNGHARGGKIMEPSYIVGEEAPRFPEFILSTNPRDRRRSRSLWMEAASYLGISGFKKSGKTSAKTKRATAAMVKKFNARTELQDAKAESHKYDGYTIDLEKRLAQIDKLLGRKGLKAEDRIALLALRGQVWEQLHPAETGGEGGSDLAAAIQANAEAQAALARELAENRKFAESTRAAVRSETDSALGHMLDESLGGTLAQTILTLSPKFVT